MAKDNDCCDIKVKKVKDGLEIKVSGKDIERCLESCVKSCCEQVEEKK